MAQIDSIILELASDARARDSSAMVGFWQSERNNNVDCIEKEEIVLPHANYRKPIILDIFFYFME